MLRRLSLWLLIVLLMLNGIGSAAAGAAMHLDTRHTASHPAPTQVLADGPHLQHAGQQGPATAPASDAQPGDCGDDCCGNAGNCKCPCMHHAQALDTPLPALTLPARRGLVAASMMLGVPAPPLGEDIRPPIR